MFSIAAINDTDSKNQWEPLAPTKEAQEFRLSQTYQEGLLKLQAKEYEKARELLENVLKDPLLPNGQVDNCGSDGHLLQLRFLTLKNLATVFLQQGSNHYESALHCYLQAVDIDSKDSVVWNQLGTLSCSMGLLSISRWAFEQGLLCSPNNWNCMEKLLEVLIAIGDEVACLSVADLILRHWPSHSRALKVKHVIEESEPTPFSPRGIDKLEPHHVRLKFLDKRKATNHDLNDNGSTKKSNQNTILHLSEASWSALAGELLKILIPLNDSNKSADFRLIIRMPCSSDNPIKEKEGVNGSSIPANTESNMNEEQHQERRSSRLERLRSRKPDKEESDFTPTKDLVKLVPQFLEPFIMGESRITNLRIDSEDTTDTQNNESIDVAQFVHKTSKNYGVYHVAGMLLEEVGCRRIFYQDTCEKFLELEELTRNLGESRTPECSLFLAELAYDFGIRSSHESIRSDFMLKASYHLCKLIESVALNDVDVSAIGSLLDNKRDFWVRFFWVSGKLSIFNGDKEKARKEFGVSLALLTNTDKERNNLVSITLPHLKAMNKLTVDLVLHEINLLEVDFLMKNSVNEMMEKGLHLECVNLLAPLLSCMKDDHVSGSSFEKDGEGADSAELSALNVLIKACERLKPVDANVYLRCHRQRLKLLMAATGVEESFGSQKSSNESELSKNSTTDLHPLLAEEVKAISQCTQEMKNSIIPCGSINGSVIPMRIIGDIQSSLLAVMCHIANICFSKKSIEVDNPDDDEKRQKCCFVDAAIAFFRLQHLNPNISIKTQIELIIAIHEMLAEHGICCASGDGEEDGAFLKLAIKHLLHLDMKLKSINKGPESTQCGDEQVLQEGYAKISGNDSNVEVAPSDQLLESGKQLTEEEKEDLEIEIDTALDQCFFCLYGLHLRSDSSYEDDLAMHKNTSRGDYQTKEQCADVFQYILPYAKASSRTGLVKLRRVLRAIRKHFPQPPETALNGNAIDKFLDDPNLCEDKLSEEAGSDGFRDSIMSIIYQDSSILQQHPTNIDRSEPYMDVYGNLYYLVAQSEEMSATDKWAGFVLTKEGEEFVQQTAKLFKYDLLFNPMRFDSWQRLATIYDEEVDLLLNDGSKQINVTGWRKNATFAQRVDTSRRRSRRCLLMTLALAQTPIQQGEIHDLLALVYYDGLQNVVPIYDQRLNLPIKDAEWKMFCENSMKHFEKAFAQKEDWSYVYYLGKLSEKLKYSREKSFAYYDKAIALNPSAVDPFYRMHASRLKLLWSCPHNDKDALKIAATYCFNQSTKETVMNILDKSNPENTPDDTWHMLYNDCLSALQLCVEGDLKHFHKARYMLAQGLYRKGESGDLEKAKDELSFCFKSSRSCFTINMWEIDSTVKKGRRKTPGRVLEVNLAESSRKFITCIRKYILFYMKLLEETGDISTLERAYISIRADKRFSLCLEDLVPIALGRYIKALVSSINQIESGTNIHDNIALEHLLEKMFCLYIEQMNLWSDICNLPEIKCPELSESSLFGYLFKYIQTLEKNCKLEALEGINEKIRKRLKNPKLSNTNCAKVHKHVSMSWCRCLIINMASITPLNSRFLAEPQLPPLSDTTTNNQLLCIDILTDQLWQSTFEDTNTNTNHLKSMQSKWDSLLLKVKDVVIKKPLEENLEAATVLLRSAYNFYRDATCAVLPSCLNLYAVPCQLLTEGHIESNLHSVDILEMNTQKKLLLWAYTLLHGRCITNVSMVIKYCEETVKLKMKKGGGSTSTTPTMHSVIAYQTGVVGKDVVGISGAKETTTLNVDPTSLTETKNPENAPNCDEGSTLLQEIETTPPVGQNQTFSSAVPLMVPCNNADETQGPDSAKT
ncbi:unnamed protein product [Lactuca saligna]|uniref:Calcineurin-binding protein cabin-1 n=1 Tax=Lactuca saligna TaxID=75948 RepID=A0AA36E0F8_LACSI|nr:unnamed protein product [Lactuca saligna]